ncbi:solute carrier family 35 member C2 [Drosophila grimshawi]|uniref:GH16885 n=1 Tax=Drosophila grimshawi TaxID=7222 RepID=B4IXC6_DROGR|nr:solute carrier family 35 member C2 [Drosophila grimshawi]EDV97458.1 GH16885 [Drosophila grimshawi]
MVAPKYQRLSNGDVGSGNDGDSNIDELELSQHLSHQNATSTASQEHRQSSSQANFKYPTDSASTQQQQQQPPHVGMTRQADARFKQMAMCSLVIVLIYLVLSIALTFYQTDIIRDYRYPLSIVVYHLVWKFMLAALVRNIFRMRWGKARVQLEWRVALRKLAPAGISSGIDIGFSNWGLALVPISLYTMTKSSTIVFILLFAFILGLERKSWSLVLIVGLIVLGLFMFTYKSTQFKSLGFIFILFASLCSGLRWSFAQLIMQKYKLGLDNPIDMIYHMQPWMITALLPLVYFNEGSKLYTLMGSLNSFPIDHIAWVIARITLGAYIAFLMEVSEFMVLCKTSSLTLSIAGIFKDICQVALAVELKGDQLSSINVVGLAVCLVGIGFHLVHKYSSMEKMSKQQLATQMEGGGEDMDTEYDFNNKTNAGNSTGSHATLTVPLLEQTDSEDELSNGNTSKENASDVIFDVLKRRDMQR